MKKFLNLIIIPAVCVIMLGMQSLQAFAQDTVTVTLYFKPDCTFCQKVDGDITTNKIDDIITINKVDISDTANNQVFIDQATTCGISAAERGVPMLVYNNECFLNSENVIKELHSLAGISDYESVPVAATPDTSQSPTPSASPAVSQQPSTLENILLPKSVVRTYSPINPIDIIFIVAIPIVFLFIAYLLVKKLKL